MCQFPLNIHESTEDLEILQRTYHTFKFPTSGMSLQPTSIAGFIHVCKLRAIESHIHQSMYRVDQPTTVDEAEVESFLNELERWKTCIPMGTGSPCSDIVASNAHNTYVGPLHAYTAALLIMLCRCYTTTNAYIYCCIPLFSLRHLISMFENARMLAVASVAHTNISTNHYLSGSLQSSYALCLWQA